MIPIFYINLATAPRRAAALEGQLSAMHLRGTRVEAVTPSGIAAEHLSRYCNSQLYHWVHPVELACSMSHLRAWKALIASGEAFGLILEDDVALSSRLPQFLAEWAAPQSRPDLARLETNLYRLRVEPRPSFTLAGVGLHRPRSCAAGAAAYLIKAECAQKLLTREELYYRPIDFALFDPAFPRRGRPSFVTAVPGLAIQLDRLNTLADVEGSSVKPAYAERQKLISRPLFRKIRFAIRAWLEGNILIGGAKVWSDLTGRHKRPMDFLS